jgi:hypothetical protein
VRDRRARDRADAEPADRYHLPRSRLDPAEGAWWEPNEAVVLTSSRSSDGPSFRGCCDVLNFYEAAETAKQYLGNHPELAGFPISIPEAIEAGQAVFADLLKEP